MSTPALRCLSQRAGGGLVRTNTPNAHTPYGRAAAYRRIASHVRDYSKASIRNRQTSFASPPPAFALTSHFLPQSVTSTASSRHVSFKEMRAERARQRAGVSESDEKKPGDKAQDKQPKSAQPEPEKSAADEAEEAFAKAKAENDRTSGAREEKQETEGEAGEGDKDKEGGEKKPPPPPPPHGDKTPWQVFTETLSQEFKSNKEWNEGTKQLGGSIHDFTQNPNVQRARSAYARAAEAASTQTGKAFLGTAGAIGKGAAWTWDTSVARGVRKAAGAVGSGMEKATRPVRETEAYRNVKDVIDDGASSRYGGWTEKEERRKRREAEEAKRSGKPGSRGHKLEVFEEDPEAGTNVTVHKDAAWKESWRNFRDASPMMQRLFGLKTVYAESENPLISTARSVSDRIAGFFAENETAQVIKKFREMDPSFQLEPFLSDMRTYILPEVLEAYVKGDLEVLKQWLSAAQFQVYSALMQQYTTAGLKSDGRILDIRNVDILSARIIDPGDVPVFVLMCRSQEVHLFVNAKSGELAAGMEDKVQQVTYAIGVTRLPEEVSNPETRGWRFIELQKSGRDYI